MLLGIGLAINAALGPLMLDVIRYHVSDDFNNQTIGLDASALLIIAPFCVILGFVQFRGSKRLTQTGAAMMSLGPGLFAMYMLPQYVVGPDYLGRPGNNQRFFLLHLALFILSAAVSLVAWNAVDPVRLPKTSRRTSLAAASVLVAGALFLVFGLHLRGVVDGLARTPRDEAFLADPTAFWFVKFLDLGIIVPASIAGAVALVRGARWGQRLTYTLIGWLTFDALAVSAMAITMVANDDPNSSEVLAVGFVVLSLGLLSMMVKLYRPFFRPREISGVANVQRSC